MTGSVAEELEVEKAVRRAVFMALKWAMGFTLPTILRSSGRTRNMWMARARRTVKK